MSKGKKDRQVRWRDRKFASSPFCEQCGCHLVHPDEFFETITIKNKLGEIQGITRKKKVVGPIPDNMATLEHNHSRLNPLRWDNNKHGKRYTKLLCVKCNQENAARDATVLPPEIFQKVNYPPGKTRAERRAYIRELLLQYREINQHVYS